MNTPVPEHCCECDSPTGRAGRADDSRYCIGDDCDAGPFCDVCDDAHDAACKDAKITRLQERLREATHLVQCLKAIRNEANIEAARVFLIEAARVFLAEEGG